MGRFRRVPHWLPKTYQARRNRRRLDSVAGLVVQVARSRLLNPQITCHRPMVRHFSWRRKRLANFEPCKCKPSRRINSFHRFPLFRPSRLCLKSRENCYLLSAQAALKRFLKCGTNFYVICARFDSISETTTRVIVTYFLKQKNVG